MITNSRTKRILRAIKQLEPSIQPTSQREIVRITKLNPEFVRTALLILEDLEIIEAYHGNRTQPRLYRINRPKE